MMELDIVPSSVIMDNDNNKGHELADSSINSFVERK